MLVQLWEGDTATTSAQSACVDAKPKPSLPFRPMALPSPIRNQIPGPIPGKMHSRSNHQTRSLPRRLLDEQPPQFLRQNRVLLRRPPLVR